MRLEFANGTTKVVVEYDPEQGIDLQGVVTQTEKSLIEQVILLTDGNKTKAAAILKVNRTTLVMKRKKHGLDMGPLYNQKERQQ